MSTRFPDLRTLTVLLCLLLLPLSACKKGTTGPSGTQGHYTVAFNSLRDGNWEIYRMNPDGSNQVRLTNDSIINVYPEWSPDGSKIVYVQRGATGPFSVWVMNADGTAQTLLADSAGDDYDERPVWSAAGKIAYAGSGGIFPGNGIFVMDASGSNRQLLSDGTAPSWSKDGTKLVFMSGLPRQIFSMNADGTNRQRLTNDSSNTRYPAWSPGGANIAFTSQRDGNNEIYAMDANGANQLRLTNNPGDDIAPSWSPDGGRIAFISSRGGSPDVFVMNADGTNQQPLTYNASAAYPLWSPDGTRILFMFAAGGNAIGAVNPDGTNLDTLSSAFDLYPAWSPLPSMQRTQE